MANPETYQLPVYREQDTGKIRVKGTEKIDPVSESPVDTAELAIALNQVLALLTAMGPNEDTPE